MNLLEDLKNLREDLKIGVMILMIKIIMNNN